MGQVITCQLQAISAGAATTEQFGAIPANIEEYTLGAIRVVSNGTVTAQGTTNFATATVNQLRAGSIVNTLATVPFSTVALVAEVPTTVTSTFTNQAIFQNGDELDVRVAHTGTGGALPQGLTFEVELED